MERTDVERLKFLAYYARFAGALPFPAGLSQEEVKELGKLAEELTFGLQESNNGTS